MDRSETETWIYPPKGATIIPSNASAAFGPAHIGDTIELIWAPADQEPGIIFTVASNASLVQSTTIASGVRPPYRHTFGQKAPPGIADDAVALAWFQFAGTPQFAPTVAFQYGFARANASQLWRQDAAAALAPTATATATAIVTLAPSGLPSDRSTATAGGISPAAAAGAATAATAAVAAAIGLFAWVAVRKRRRAGSRSRRPRPKELETARSDKAKSLGRRELHRSGLHELNSPHYSELGSSSHYMPKGPG